ncbi:hypothetical protein [Priestia megaterium]|uniref:hypothetical protein n=1 Tax=Priestia megaterium TaxID=1404 RepID=UPI0032D968B2
MSYYDKKYLKGNDCKKNDWKDDREDDWKHHSKKECFDKEDDCCSAHHDPCENTTLVDKVICSKDVQKVAEFALPAAVGPLAVGDGLIATILALLASIAAGAVNVRVVPNFNGIRQEVTVVKDKIINLGTIPANLELISVAGLVVATIPIQIFFQEHTDCPGVCPGDTVVETRPIVEAVLNQPLIGTTPEGGTFINLLLFKAIVRTHLTVTRQVIKSKDGSTCDANPHRCDPTGTPGVINSPINLTPTNITLPAPGPGA